MNGPGASLIRLEGLRKAFGDDRVLDGVDLEVRRGEIMTVIGKSGVGKSVLLKLMINLFEPDGGRIWVEGRPLEEMSPAERKALRRKMSYVFQGTALFDSLTTFENIALPLRESAKLTRDEIDRRVRLRMDQLDLAGIDDKFPAQLSGGMKKRVALARALVTDPEIVLFDEPTTGLDPIRKHAVHSMIADYQKRLGFTAVLVSHEIPDVLYFSQRIAMLDEGKVRFVGTPAALLASDDPVVREFLGGLSVQAEGETGMAHPQDLDRCVSREVARTAAGAGALGLLTLTLANLDDVNARVGFVAGQKAMGALLGAVRGRLRAGDTAARVGLDQIAVLFSPASSELARSWCEGLLSNLRSGALFSAGPPADLCLRFSAGYAEADAASTWPRLLEAAEEKKQPLEEFAVCP
ncbi:MAG TPA: ATP-binding cassette domain-containing protein [bacterium]